MASINVTPLLGVVSSLLMLFIAFPAATNPIHSPAVGEPGACGLGAPTPAHLSIDEFGQLFWDGKSISRAELAERVERMARSESGWLTLRPAPHASFQQVVSVVNTLDQRGFRRFDFANWPN